MTAGLPRTLKLVIGYDGTGFSGWQRQKQGRTIQGEIELCLERMNGEAIHLHGAGRTDAGVHAEGMVAHFHTASAITCAVFQRGLNAMLPPAIRIFSAEEVANTFHARFSAIGKEYRYEVYTGRIPPARRGWYSRHGTIRACLAEIEGTHDFSSFENSGSRDKDDHSGRGAVRTIHAARLVENSPELRCLQFNGDGFLRNMIRNLVGTLLEAGRGKLTPADFAAILAAKNRTAGGPTAPAHGLWLKKVFY
jgi:tRNA pseudouridine38-40 synthase